MADFTDVENVLKTMIGNVVYPNATTQPSIVNAAVRVFRGWPSGPQLDTDMPAGNLLVSIYSQANVEAKTTRFPRELKIVTPPAPTITATATDNSITFAGTATVPQYATIVIDGAAQAYSYPVQTNDTPATIAAGLAALIPSSFSPAASGATLTVDGRVLAVRMGAPGVLGEELRRQRRTFQVTIWAGTDALRTAVAKPIDTALAAVDRIALPDGFGGRILYSHSVELDNTERVKFYRRDLFYSVDFPTTDQVPGYEVTAPNVLVTPSPAT